MVGRLAPHVVCSLNSPTRLIMFLRFTPRKNWQEKAFERVFKDRKLRSEQLLPFGFVQNEHGYSYRADLLSGMFVMNFEIQPDGALSVAVTGTGENENDLLHAPQQNPVSFLDRSLRKEYEEELWHVAECCFEPDVFKSELTRGMITHIRATYGDELEFLWRKFPGNAIVRRQDNGKWYAALLVVPRSKLVGNFPERMEILNLRANPETLGSYVDHISRFPGYHMNKKNWVSLCLDGSVPFEELTEHLEISYRLALK